jgi:hypothetical protein
VAKGEWQWQAERPGVYPGAGADERDRRDLATYLHYAGLPPDAPTTLTLPWSDFAAPATRGWFARALWQTYRNGIGTADIAADLGGDPARWGVPYCEIANVPYVGANCVGTGIAIDQPQAASLSRPGGDGQSLRLALRGGPGFSNVLFQRRMDDFPSAWNGNTLTLDLHFLFDQDPARVQAIEFAMSDWRREADGKFRVYDWELQWHSAEGGPQWNIWAGRPGCGGQGWSPVGAPGGAAALAPDQWHHLTLNASIEPDRPDLGGYGTHYISFIVDGIEQPLGQTFAVDQHSSNPDCAIDQEEQTANVHVQLDGPRETGDGYAVYLDQMEVRWSTAIPTLSPTGQSDEVIGSTNHLHQARRRSQTPALRSPVTSRKPPRKIALNSTR